MIGIIMAGGKGSRMELNGEKLLLEYQKPVILHVVDSLKKSNCFSKIIAVTSPNSPDTKKLLEENNVEIFDSSGLGYVEDLNSILNTIDDSVFVTSGDLPLLDSEIIQEITKLYNPQNTWTSILISKKFLSTIGIKSDISIILDSNQCHYTGISLVNATKISSLDDMDETYEIIDDKRIGFNLNTKEDYDLLSTA